MFSLSLSQAEQNFVKQHKTQLYVIRAVSWKIKGFFNGALRVFQLSFMGISKKFKSVSRKFQRCFNKGFKSVARKF